MKTSSAKAKGRRLAARLRERFLKALPGLAPGDITVTPSGVQGPDLYFSPKTLEIAQYAVECKNVEKINIWGALKQCEDNAETLSLEPLLCFSRNRSPDYVVVRAEHFFDLVEKANAEKGPKGA